jgi:hypothetical protein
MGEATWRVAPMVMTSFHSITSVTSVSVQLPSVSAGPTVAVPRQTVGGLPPHTLRSVVGGSVALVENHQTSIGPWLYSKRRPCTTRPSSPSAAGSERRLSPADVRVRALRDITDTQRYQEDGGSQQ